MISLRSHHPEAPGEPISRPIARRPRPKRYARTIFGVGEESSDRSGREAPSRAPELARGASVGPYVVDYRIGRGRHGITYKAIRGGDMREVVLKVWDRPVGSEELSKQAKLIGVSQNHPHLARVLDAGLIDGRFLYQARELLYGEPWDRWLRNRRDREAQSIAWIAAELTTALASLHEVGLTHGTVHPGNVLIVENGGRARPVLLDCGLGPTKASPTDEAVVRDVAALASTVRLATDREIPLRPVGAPPLRPGSAPGLEFGGRADLDAVLAPVAQGARRLSSPDRLASAVLEAATPAQIRSPRQPTAWKWGWWALVGTIVAVSLAAAHVATLL